MEWLPNYRALNHWDQGTDFLRLWGHLLVLLLGIAVGVHVHATLDVVGACGVGVRPEQVIHPNIHFGEDGSLQRKRKRIIVIKLRRPDQETHLGPIRLVHD